MTTTKQEAARFVDDLLGKRAVWLFAKGKKDRPQLRVVRPDEPPSRRLARRMAQLAVGGRYWGEDDREALMGAARARKLRLEPAPHEEETFAEAFPETGEYWWAYNHWPDHFRLWPDPYERKRKWLVWSPAEEGNLDSADLERSMAVDELFARAEEKYQQSRRFDRAKLLEEYLENVDLRSLAHNQKLVEVLERLLEHKREQERGKKEDKQKDRLRKAAIEARSVPSALEEQFYPDQRLGKPLELFQTPDSAYRNIDRDAIRLLSRMIDATGEAAPLDVYNEAVAMLPKYRNRRLLLTALLLGAGPLAGGLMGGPLGALGGLAAGGGLSALLHLGANHIPGLGPAWYLRHARKLHKKLRKRLEKDTARGKPLGMDPESASEEILKRLKDLEERKYLDLARVSPGQLPHTLSVDPGVVQAAYNVAAGHGERIGPQLGSGAWQALAKLLTHARSA